MVFEHIENLKRIYTDQLVIVDDNRTELGRFQGLTGTVKTVNMSGRALVEFDGYNNIGWYDIDVDFLKLVDEPVHETETVSTPVPPAEAATPAAEAAVETTTSTVETPAEKPAPAKADAGNMSVADMLASARASAAGEETPAAEAPAAVDTENMSVADMLAAARASAAGEETPTAEAPATEAPAEEQAAEEPQEAAAEDTPAEEPATAPAGDTGNAQALKETDDVDGMLDYCRKVDG
tara:strand:- start:498 stop:1208 length:711 start_codon:yes stop_codon:yes gene_type:complete